MFNRKSKNTIIYNANFEIVKTHRHPKSPSSDRDLHLAGSERTIGLSIVSDIMNVRNEIDAVNFMHFNEGGSPISLIGDG